MKTFFCERGGRDVRVGKLKLKIIITKKNTHADNNLIVFILIFYH